MLKRILELEKEDILEWLSECEDDVIRLVSFQWKGFTISWQHDYSYLVVPLDTNELGGYRIFATWGTCLDYIIEEVLKRYEGEIR